MPRRSEFKGIAFDILSSFVSRNNDLEGYWALGKLYSYAKEHSGCKLQITLAPEKSESISEPFKSMSQHYLQRIASIMEKRNLSPEWLKSAHVTLEFEAQSAKPQFFSLLPNGKPFFCTLVIVDDLTRKHHAQVVGWCAPHNSDYEHRSNRIK